MSKWREDYIFEIMSHLNSDNRLKLIYEKEIQKSIIKYPYADFFDRMEKCYNSATLKLSYESL
jgi:hypothetical protein